LQKEAGFYEIDPKRFQQTNGNGFDCFNAINKTITTLELIIKPFVFLKAQSFLSPIQLKLFELA